MADSTDPCPSPSVQTATPGASTSECILSAIDLNLPPLDDLMDDQDPNSSISNCRSVASANQSGDPPLLFNSSGLIEELNNGNEVHRIIKGHFVSRLAGLGMQVTSLAIHQNCRSDVSVKARAEAFQDYAQALQKQHGHDAGIVNWAWYPTSKEGAAKILSYGFDNSGKAEDDSVHDSGVCFAPYDHPLESVISAPIDEDGLGHLLLCRVVLGKTKLVVPGLEQSYPRSGEYNSGIDDLSFPRRYLIWSTNMNTCVLPMFIISFKAVCCLEGLFTASEKPPQSTAPSLPYLILMHEFLKIVPPSHASLNSKNRNHNKETKTLWREMLEQMMQIARDRLDNTSINMIKPEERKIPLDEMVQSFKRKTRDRLMNEVTKSFKTKEGPMTRQEVMQKIRNTGGDRLYAEIMKIVKNKEPKV